MMITEKVSQHVVSVPAVERIAAVMQSQPELWSARVVAWFSASGGVELGMHHVPWDEVHELALLLGLSVEPVRANHLSETDMVAVGFGEERLAGGIEITWYVELFDARLVLGSALTALLDE